MRAGRRLYVLDHFELLRYGGRFENRCGQGSWGLRGLPSPSVKNIDTRTDFTSTGEWITAGFNGKSMVGIMILGKEDELLERVVARPGDTLANW